MPCTLISSKCILSVILVASFSPSHSLHSLSNPSPPFLQASSVALDQNGSTPVFSKMVKKFALRKDWRESKREQDRIIKYIVNQTKDASFNYIITRPSDAMIWDKPSRKKLSASKSLPGPFPITNTDLAEFTLSALRLKKVYNSCPYVVQDGI